ncbi:uncharacterized protein C8Q71DRAFT_7432 [Rhodofomes roseus]|uniref:Secreted protein n=1 Tax=Rhodofomes roseus TaxID=34475 RepID=A0ABQ8KYN2_9APHY|nr:uncharacterized protein C8Q71DRAFT_7432 [Rhodofomes roseus]KAH9843622.1 hypothetical protein C8Q71DRAFT_7432 [Rhodofomes roseus]
MGVVLRTSSSGVLCLSVILSREVPKWMAGTHDSTTHTISFVRGMDGATLCAMSGLAFTLLHTTATESLALLVHVAQPFLVYRTSISARSCLLNMWLLPPALAGADQVGEKSIWAGTWRRCNPGSILSAISRLDCSPCKVRIASSLTIPAIVQSEIEARGSITRLLLRSRSISERLNPASALFCIW